MSIKKTLGLAGLVAGAGLTLAFLAYRISNGTNVDPLIPATSALIAIPFYKEAKRERIKEKYRREER